MCRPPDARAHSTPRTILTAITALSASVLVSSCADARSGDAQPHVDSLPRLSYAEEVRIGDADDPRAAFGSFPGERCLAHWSNRT